jgi:hypothetical protein
MVSLGLMRAQGAGYEHDFDSEGIRNAARREIDSPEITPGDLGLFLWADARAGRRGEPDLPERLDASLADAGGLAAREGMELAWIVQGLALNDCGRRERFDEALEVLLGNQARSGLFYHSGTSGLRRRFPNFATEIYSVLALATVARLGLDDRALPAARRAADVLLVLQLEDGGWPWLYDADRGEIVERFEVYSVHQHGMAPMALLELAEVAGEERYVRAARRGLAWIHGRNELRQDMLDPHARMIYRSFRRRRPLDRLALYANTASARVLARPVWERGSAVELNPTCRPYELGWLLEAWCGRTACATVS